MLQSVAVGICSAKVTFENKKTMLPTARSIIQVLCQPTVVTPRPDAEQRSQPSSMCMPWPATVTQSGSATNHAGMGVHLHDGPRLTEAFLGVIYSAVALTSTTGSSPSFFGNVSICPSTQAFLPSTFVLVPLSTRN